MDGTDSVTNVAFMGFSDKVFTLGDGASNTMVGTAGNDAFEALGGHDNLTGAAGDDTLYGGDGNDTIRSCRALHRAAASCRSVSRTYPPSPATTISRMS